MAARAQNPAPDANSGVRTESKMAKLARVLEMSDFSSSADTKLNSSIGVRSLAQNSSVRSPKDPKFNSVASSDVENKTMSNSEPKAAKSGKENQITMIANLLSTKLNTKTQAEIEAKISRESSSNNLSNVETNAIISNQESGNILATKENETTTQSYIENGITAMTKSYSENRMTTAAKEEAISTKSCKENGPTTTIKRETLPTAYETTTKVKTNKPETTLAKSCEENGITTANRTTCKENGLTTSAEGVKSANGTKNSIEKTKATGTSSAGKGASGATDEASEHQRSFTIEEIVESGDDFLGLRVVVRAKEGSYMGVINYVLPASRRLALEKVSNPKTGKKRVGLLTFFFHSVVSITVVGEDREARQRLLKDAYQEEQRGKQVLMKKLVPLHLSEKFNENHRRRADNDDEGPQNNAPAPPPPPPHPRVGRPSKWVIIDKVDEAFEKAISLLGGESVISLCAQGQNLGRSGSLSLLAAATPTVIFLIDVAQIRMDAVLSGGLGRMLMDEGIVKVVHDCRYLEDFLHHQFGLNMVNVFDTQAAEIYVYMLNHRSSVPSFVSSLPSLLSRYLGISHQHTLMPTAYQNDDSAWLERPLANGLCEGAARMVRYLRELRLSLIDLMLVDLSQVTNIYLASLRDKDSATVGSIETHVTPPDIQKLGKRSVLNNPDPQVYFTRDSFRMPVEFR